MDVTRGIAVLGMVTAHVGVIGPDFWTATGWLAVVNGRSAATFAVLAGVSLALLSGGPRPVTGPPLSRVRVRVGARALLLLVLGLVLTGLGTPVAVILPSYAAYFLLVLPVVRARPAALVGAAATVALVGPPACFAIADALAGNDGPYALAAELLVTGYYPAGIWMAYVLTGLAVGRFDLTGTGVRQLLLSAGPCLAVVGYAGSALAVRLAAGASPDVLRLLTTEPHADTTFEVVGNTGVALGVLGLALVVADRWPRWVYPVAATGALALTVYSLQIVAIAALGDGVVRRPDVGVHLLFLGVSLAAASAWRAWLGRGPLERVLHGLSTGAADLVTGRTTKVPPVA